LRNPALLTASGLPPMSARSFYGPLRTGKTLLAKAIAKECGVNFIFRRRAGNFYQMARRIRGRRAADFPHRPPVAPTVIFFDQLDRHRAGARPALGLDDDRPVVSQLLAELDASAKLSRCDRARATKPHRSDRPSILRPGRFGVHIAVGLPDAQAQRQILAIALRTASAAGAGDLDAIIDAIGRDEKFSGAKLRQLCDEAKRIAIKRTGFTKAAAPTVRDVLSACRRAPE